jgi:hypothetical protein
MDTCKGQYNVEIKDINRLNNIRGSDRKKRIQLGHFEFYEQGF